MGVPEQSSKVGVVIRIPFNWRTGTLRYRATRSASSYIYISRDGCPSESLQSVFDALDNIIWILGLELTRFRVAWRCAWPAEGW